MIVDAETINAIKAELMQIRFAAINMPEMSISELYDCGCVGPIPECKCKQQFKLLTKFLET